MLRSMFEAPDADPRYWEAASPDGGHPGSANLKKKRPGPDLMIVSLQNEFGPNIADESA